MAMRKVLTILAAGVAIASSASAAFAQTHEEISQRQIGRREAGGLEWTFGASTSYVYDINSPDSGTTGINPLGYANMETRDQSFNIDLVQLGVSGERGAASYGATIDFGDLAALADNSTDSNIALQTAWLGYDMDMVGITAGRIATPIGYEVLEPWGNRNISRSYGWQVQPINHDGATVHATMDMFEMMVGAVNNFTVAQNPVNVNDTDNQKGVIGSISSSFSEALNGHVSGIYTNDFGHSAKITEIDTFLHGDLEPNGVGLRYSVEHTWGKFDPDAGSSNDIHSFVGRLGGDLGPTGIDVRYEYVDDDGVLSGVSTNIHSAVLDLTWALVEGMDFRLEYRFDKADDDIYGDDDSFDDTDQIVQAQLMWYPEL
jgi:hypothetical protein